MSTPTPPDRRFPGFSGAPREPVLAHRSGGQEDNGRRRSVILETITRVVFHTVLVFSVFLLVSGHKSPGGGFVGGLVAGLAFTLRYVAGGRAELKAAVPVEPGVALGLGLGTAAAFGMVGYVGGEPLGSDVLHLHLPLFGDVELVTSLFFDVGVFLIVLGLVLGVLRTLGAEAEQAEGSISGATEPDAPISGEELQ